MSVNTTLFHSVPLFAKPVLLPRVCPEPEQRKTASPAVARGHSGYIDIQEAASGHSLGLQEDHVYGFQEFGIHQFHRSESGLVGWSEPNSNKLQVHIDFLTTLHLTGSTPCWPCFVRQKMSQFSSSPALVLIASLSEQPCKHLFCGVYFIMYYAG